MLLLCINNMIAMEKISYFFKNTKPAGQLVGGCLLWMLGTILMSGLAMLVPPSPYHTATDIRVELAMQGVGQLLMFLLPALLFSLLFYGSPLFCLKTEKRAKEWVLGLLAVLMLVLMLPLCDRLTIWNQQFDFGPLEHGFRAVASQSQAATDRLLSLPGAGDLLLQLIILALVPAVCEELFFRGCLQQVLCGWMRSKHLAIAIAAAVFALAHGDAYGILPRLLLGLLLGYVFFYSGSIIASMCAHFFNNAVIVVIYYMYHRGAVSAPPSVPLDMPWMWVIMCMVGALLLGYQYFVKKSEK